MISEVEIATQNWTQVYVKDTSGSSEGETIECLPNMYGAVGSTLTLFMQALTSSGLKIHSHVEIHLTESTPPTSS